MRALASFGGLVALCAGSASALGASVQIVDGRVDLSFYTRGEDPITGRNDPNDDPTDNDYYLDLKQSYAVNGFGAQTHTLENEGWAYDGVDPVNRVSYGLTELADGARFEVDVQAQSRFGEIYSTESLASFTLTFTTTKAMVFEYSVPAPEIPRFTQFESTFNGQVVGAENIDNSLSGVKGFPIIGVDEAQLGPIIGDFLQTGVLGPGTYTFTVRDWLDWDNEEALGAGFASLTLREVGAVIPTPAAACMGLALLGGAAVRRWR